MNIDDLFGEYKADRKLNEQGSLMGSERQATLLRGRSPLRATVEDLFKDPLSMTSGPSSATISFAGMPKKLLPKAKGWLRGVSKTPEGEHILRRLNVAPEKTLIAAETPEAFMQRTPGASAPLAEYLSPRDPRQFSGVPAGGAMVINTKAFRGPDAEKIIQLKQAGAPAARIKALAAENSPAYAGAHELTHVAIDPAVKKLTPEEALAKAASLVPQIPGSPQQGALQSLTNVSRFLQQAKAEGIPIERMTRDPFVKTALQNPFHETVAYTNEAAARKLPLPQSLTQLLREHNLTPPAPRREMMSYPLSYRKELLKDYGKEGYRKLLRANP